MDTNSTSPGPLPTMPHTQQATGISIFWALLSLALNAMIQSSFSGHTFSGDAFRGALWPHRSSPFLCLVDATADIWIMTDKRRQPEKYEQHTLVMPRSSEFTAVAMRLVLFAVGVLPQALKLFSMRGVPISQTIGAVFFFSTVVSMVRTLNSVNPDHDLATFAGSPPLPTSWSTKDTIRRTAVLAHVCTLYAVWHRIGPAFAIDVSEPVADVVDWCTFALVVLWTGHAVQHTISTIVRGTWTLPRMPALMLLAMANSPSFPGYMLIEARRCRIGAKMWTYTAVANVALYSFVCSWLLFAGVRVVLGLHRKFAGAADRDASVLPTAAPNEGAASPTDAAPELETERFSDPAAGDLGLGSAAHSAQEQHVVQTASSSTTAIRETHNATSIKSPSDRTPTQQAPVSRWRFSDAFPIRLTRGQRAPGSPAPGPLSLLIELCFALLHVLLVLIIRINVGLWSLFDHAGDWAKDRLTQGQNPDVCWVAFALMNAVTAVTWYAAVFDGEGTTAPGWTTMLG